MKKKIRMSSLVFLVMAIPLAATPIASFSASPAPCTPPAVKIVSVQGLVEVRRAGQTQWQPARLNDEYCIGDLIQVRERGRADIALANQPVLRLDENTSIIVGGIRDETTSLIEIMRGALYFFSRRPRNLEVRTPFVNAGVEGTEGLIAVAANVTLLSIFEGIVRAENAFGTLTINGGQSAVAEQGRAPTLSVAVRPRDAVQWAIYYVPTLYFRPSDFPAGQDWQGMVRNSIDAYQRRDLAAAFDAVRNVPATVNEPGFFTYRAALLLAVGRVGEANRDIDAALRLDPSHSDAIALQAIIAVVQNEKERALGIAKKAVTADPKSAAALIALSYAQQANFDLGGALSSLQQAVRLDPKNALAWARLAELWLSFSRLDEALEAAEKAVAIDPNLARTQTILGFAYLTRIQTEEAKQAFERAIQLDQADGLPRLGLGLAKIRDGDLLEGRREIDIAVSLDPDNALYRSYLGKAYYEEKKDKQAADQYEMAKQLDPKDPTAYFYDAIRKQTTNRPVEALQDMEKAIERNDNRAVYRSSLQLDADLAARSASLGRVYSDLGFQQLALVEGWKSVNTDPSNFSAHRLLADSYSILPRHEIARVSELLQSQLLQPLSTTPIQPRLAESNLFLISAGGPGSLSFNEFNPLFNRKGVNFQTTGLAGENNTYSGEGVLSGIYKNTSFSLGGVRFQTDGWRQNTNQKDSVGNAFLQVELSPQTSFQSEWRRRETEQGDLRQRFFPEDFRSGLTDRVDSFSMRLGGRHSLSPDSVILSSFMYQERDNKQRDVSPPQPLTFVNLKRPQDAISVEFEHVFRSPYFNLISGVGYFDINEELQTITGTILPPPLNRRTATIDTGIRHFNTYLYGHINPLRDVTLTAGASFDYVTGKRARIPGGEESQFNPKFGITWNPYSGTTVRAAVFRVLKRTLITDQTLEPTQVAGFNQFFDDVGITEAWRYGAAIDQKFKKDLFGGVKFSARDLKIPLIRAAGPSVVTQKLDGKEYLGSVYLFWTPHPWLALRTEYIFERFENDPSLQEPIRLATQRVPLGAVFFHPSGLGASFTGTYYNQDGKFVRLATGLAQSARDDFWTVDAAINYRLPHRYGFVTVGAANLFDRKFKYFEVDRDNFSVLPKRTLLFRVTLALP